MAQAQHSVTVRRPIEEVFAYLADGEKCPEWRSGVLDIKRISGDGSVGTTYAQGVKGPMGRRIEADYRITTYVPPTLLEFQTVAGPARPHGRYQLEPRADGTRLTFSLDAAIGGLRGLFMGPAVQRTMTAEVRNIERVKDVLEARPAG